MKTKNIFKALVLAAVLVSACSKNDIADDFKGYTLPVTVNVSRQGDDATKATYTDNGDRTGSLAFSAGDKLFVAGDHTGAGSFAGVLDYDAVSGKFSGTIVTENEYTGTAEELLSSATDPVALLIPAGYISYEYLELDDEITPTAGYYQNKTNAFALTKAAAVEQFSFELAETYSSRFTLSPQNAIVSFTISGLTASKEVAVSFDTYMCGVISKSVTTSAEGVATFAIGLDANIPLENCTLTVDGNAIAMPTKTVVAGKIYNMSRSVAPAPARTLAEATAEDIGKVAGADGKIYANVAAAQAASTTACAIIAYVGSATGESQNHGLAIAMKDAAAGCYVMWSSSNNDESLLTNYTDVSQAVSTFQSGLSNSQYYEFDNETDYPAFYAALHNTISTSDGISADAPDPGTSGWFLPSLYQWNKIVQGLSGQSADLSDYPNDNYTASSLNAKITAAGGDVLQDDAYWSSTEYDGDYAWLFEAYYGRVINKSPKNYEYYVRSVFAF